MNGLVVWFTGLPAAGKSTLAQAVCKRLAPTVHNLCVLDSDRVRAALFPGLGYDRQRRAGFYTALGNLAGLLAHQGLVVLVPATAHERRFREHARTCAPGFVEVYVDSDREQCEKRDVKGLYRAARQGQIEDLPGLDVAYEPPGSPDFVAHGGRDDHAARAIAERILERMAT